MLIIIFLAVTLACQVGFVSILCPRRIVQAFQSAVDTESSEVDSHQALKGRYVLINYAIAILGLPVLLLCVTLYFNGTMTMTGLLLSIGVVFLIQISTIAIPFYNGVLPVQQTSNESPDALASAGGETALFSILPLAPALMAGGLYLAYVITLCVLWNHSGASQLPKIVLVTVTNLLFFSAILWSYRGLFKDSDARVERYNELARMGPIMIFGSIFVTFYFFAKEILFVFDLHQLRPVMMSVALQMIAIVVFNVLCVVKSDRTMA